MINPQRLKQAREMAELTQTQLAELVGVEQPAISQAERGIFSPSPELLDRLAFQLKVPPSFFMQPSMFEFPEGSLAFRSTLTMSQANRTRARKHAELSFALAEYMLEKLDWPAHRIPRLTESSPAMAARIMRSQLGLAPDSPINNLTNILERAGALILLLPFMLRGGDGFSAWIAHKIERPVIALGLVAAGDRLRFSLAHELGHLVMHQAPHGTVTEFESEANAFAAELLMPAEAMQHQIDRPVSLTQLATLKGKWRVSIQALLRRARDLAICTDRQYRYLCEQIGVLGWRTMEPGTIPLERPRAIRKMAEELYGTGPQKSIDYSQLASSLHLMPAYVRELLELYVGADQLRGTVRTEGNPIVPFTQRKSGER